MKENNAFLFVGNMPSFKDLLDEVSSIPEEEWVRYMDRRVGVAAGKTDTIPLIYDKKHRIDSGILHENYKTFSKYLDDVVSAVSPHIGEVKVKQAMLTRLQANTVISRHMDKGPITAKTHRIHVPVITNTSCIFSVGDEYRNLEAGQIWIIDNVNRYHGVENNGTNDRVHLIVDAI